MINSFNGEYAFLSNFYPALITYKNINYPTSEHAFQAAKTLDAEKRQMIAILDTPGKAKRAGRKLEIRPDWESVKLYVMLEILRIKFSNSDLACKLISTGQKFLAEGNNWNDTFWGVCSGKGKNQLGRLLMRVRAEIFSEKKGIYL